MTSVKEAHFEVQYEGVEKQFEGIFSRLHDITGKNPVVDGSLDIITPTKAHDEYLPQNLVEYGNALETSYWNFASYDPNSDENWLIFDFKKNHRISISAYTIRSGGSSHPKSWRIEGSYDQNNWTLIHEINNCSLLNRPRATHTFIVEDYEKKPELKSGFPFIRFVQVENMSPKRERKYRINLKAIEFFGHYHYVNE